MHKLIKFITSFKLIFPQLIHSKKDVLQLLHKAASRNIIEINTLDIMENILGLSDIQAREIMTAKPHMVCIKTFEYSTPALSRYIRTLGTTNNHLRFDDD